MFEEYTFDAIVSRMLSNVSDDLDKREGAVIYDAIAPAALELAEVYGVLDMVLNEMYADSASYYFLIKRAAERGLLPKEATRARCKMVVTPADSLITAGDRFNLESLNYTVIKAIEDEQGAYIIECETEGTVGNQQLGELIPIESEDELNDLETAELVEILELGENEEDVEHFRERYYESFKNKAFGGNKEDYKQKVNGIAGVGACKVERAWKEGYNPSKFIPNETIATWYNTISEETVDTEVYEWLTLIYNAAADKLLTVGGTVQIILINSEYKSPSSALIQTVQNILDPDSSAGEGDGIVPIGHVVKVSGVKDTIMDISYSITYKSGYSFSDIKDTICDAVDGYFEQLRSTWESSDNLIVRISQLEMLALSIEGILDISQILINGKTDNFILDGDCIPVRGEING